MLTYVPVYVCMQEAAFAAYGERRFQEAVNLLTRIMQQDERSSRWPEMRAQASAAHLQLLSAMHVLHCSLSC